MPPTRIAGKNQSLNHQVSGVNGGRGEECCSPLVLLTLALASALSGLSADLLEVLLQGSQILTGLGELALLHALTHIPVHEGTLGVHEVELVVQAGEDLANGGRVGDHAHGALHLGQVAARHHGGGLVVDAALEARGAPVDELDGALGLDGGHSGVHVLGHHITAVHQAARHVLAVAGVALDHHGGGLEHGVGDLGHGQLLVVRLLSGDDGRVGGQHEVDAGVGHQVGLELGDVHVQGAIKAQGRGQGGNDLRDQAVQVGVGGALNVQGAAADVVDGLIVEHDGHVGVLQQGVGGQHRVVGLDHGVGHLGGGVDGEAQLGLLAVVHGQALQQQGAQAGAGATAHGVEHQEALQAGAVVGQLADAVQRQVDNLLADGVVATGKVVGSILLAGDQLLGVEQLAVGAGADLVHHSGLQVQEDGTGNVLASTSLGEEGVEGIVTATNGLVGGHLAVRLDAVLQAVELPAGIADLHAGLAQVDGDGLTHGAFVL
mmetsp:Transcript_20367/g.51604  ORF Transcript_20367/g.51604 Transcript_20367/m.51604 type:complete len:489 (-) Transcript_20367:102-1568(-)